MNNNIADWLAEDSRAEGAYERDECSVCDEYVEDCKCPEGPEN